MAEGYLSREKYCDFLYRKEGNFLDDYGKGWSAGIAAARASGAGVFVVEGYH